MELASFVGRPCPQQLVGNGDLTISVRSPRPGAEWSGLAQVLVEACLMFRPGVVQVRLLGSLAEVFGSRVWVWLRLNLTHA